QPVHAVALQEPFPAVVCGWCIWPALRVPVPAADAATARHSARGIEHLAVAWMHRTIAASRDGTAQAGPPPCAPGRGGPGYGLWLTCMLPCSCAPLHALSRGNAPIRLSLANLGVGAHDVVLA